MESKGAGPAKLKGPVQIAAAVSMRSLDTIFRKPLTGHMPVVEMVLAEHAIGALAFLPVLLRNWKKAVGIGLRGGLYLIGIGAGGSALGLFFFTEAFKYGNPSVAILLQKTQPIIAVILAAWLLGERVTKRFALLAAIALASSFFIAFPGGAVSLTSAGIRATAYALLAALFWGSSTVFGRALTRSFEFPVLTALRYWVGLATSAALLLIIGPSAQFMQLAFWNIVPLSLMALFTGGVIPLMLYYKGLSTTKAKVATFAEMAYPVAAVAVNWAVLGFTLDAVQIVSGAALLAAIALMALGES